MEGGWVDGLRLRCIEMAESSAASLHASPIVNRALAKIAIRSARPITSWREEKAHSGKLADGT